MNYRADDSGWIRFSRPEPGALRRQGLLPVDMHVHTNHSDSPTRVRDALKLAARQGIGLSITDHNRISGALEALRLDTGVPVVPGIEVSADDGPHILLYFFSYGDLREFYARHIERNTRSAPYIGIRLTTEEILDAREGYPCVAAEAHPCGYVFLNRGIERGITGECIGEDLFSRLDALEVICGGMARSHNRRAAELANEHQLGRTGGTDGHLLYELGGVVTCPYAETTEELLEAVLRRETIIIGQEKTIFGKAVMGTAVLPHHLPYTVPILRSRWEQNLPRIERFVQSRRTRKKDSR